MPTLLVTGANRGIGLEFARQYAAAGWRVLAGCRSPDAAGELRALAGDVTAVRLDVTDHASVDAAAAAAGPVDVLVNNAGVYGPDKMTLGRLDYAAWRHVLEVNTLGPLKVAEAFADRVAASDRKLIVCVSSTMGSVAANREGRHYLYRSSKAALNACVKSLAIDLHGRGVTAVAVCPGWVRTDMGGADADLAPEESVGGLRRLIDRLTPADGGKFFSHTGAEIPW